MTNAGDWARTGTIAEEEGAFEFECECECRCGAVVACIGPDEDARIRLTVGDRDVLLLWTVEMAGETGGERGDIGDCGDLDDELGEVGIAELGCEDTSAKKKLELEFWKFSKKCPGYWEWEGRKGVKASVGQSTWEFLRADR